MRKMDMMSKVRSKYAMARAQGASRSFEPMERRSLNPQRTSGNPKKRKLNKYAMAMSRGL